MSSNQPPYNRLVATAVDSLKPGKSATHRAASWPRIFEYWHLLSLDAPTVAALWSLFFARTMRIRLPWHDPLLLALGTWLIYVADRHLDGYHPHTELRPRHRFHAKYRSAFLASAAIIVALVLWLIRYRLSPRAFGEDTMLFVTSMLYLLLVHRQATKPAPWLPKELAVGIVFAAATAVPAWSRLAAGHADLLPAVALFAALCWFNCIAIERWESLVPDLPSSALRGSHPTTRWAAHHLVLLALSLAALSLAGLSATLSATALGRSPRSHLQTAWIYAAAALAFLGFARIDRRRKRFSAKELRILADLVLLTPLLFLPFV